MTVNPSASRTTHQWCSHDVTCLGITTVDDVYSLTRLPSGDTKSSANDHRRVSGGVAANAASAIARLGGRARLISCLGDDPDADFAVGELEALGVDVRAQRIRDRSTPSSAVMIDRTGARMIVNHVDPDFFALADVAAADSIGNTKAVLVDGRWPSGARPALAGARALGVPGVIDVDRPLAPADRDLLMLASHLVFSHAALASITGAADPVNALEIVQGSTSAWVAVTLGADGVWWMERSRARHLPAHDIDAVDTLAAGDVFHGAFTLGLTQLDDEAAALEFASATAALKCMRPGGPTTFPTAAMVDEFSAERPPLRDLEVSF